MRRKINPFLLGCLAALLISCGGGGVIGLIASGGIGGTGISFGPILLLGSATVNGTKFNTDTAIISIDGDTSKTFADLKVGYVVRVTGDLNTNTNTGTATQLEYEETVRGPVENLKPVAGTFEVLGQTVRTDPLTVFDNVVLDATATNALKNGDLVDVSGIRDANDNLVASYVGKSPTTATDFKVTGVVAPPLTASSFKIANLTVQHTSQTSLLIGDVVRVKGKSSNYDPTTRTLTADSIGPGIKPELSGEVMELEGFIESIDDPTGDRFTVNGIPVDASSATFEGNTAIPLAVGVEVEVEGNVVNDPLNVGEKLLKAVKVGIEADNGIDIEAKIDAIDSVAKTLQVLGSQVTIQVNNLTQMKDETASTSGPFGFADLKVGDKLEMRGFLDDSGKLVAGKLDRTDPAKTRAILQAQPKNISLAGATLTMDLLGVAITADGTTRYQDTDGTSISQSAFQTKLNTQPSLLVKARWNSFSQTTDIVDELSLESE